MSYKSVYVWPNPAIPFRLYFDSPECRIFIIENLQHNYEWIKQYHKKFKESDYFFVILGSHWSAYLLNNANDMFEYLGLKKEKFFILYNDDRDRILFEKAGFNGEIINQNCWLDYNKDMKILPNIHKEYDAIYVGRMIEVKRHYLAGKVKNLALIAGNIYGQNKLIEPPPHVYRNQEPLSPSGVAMKINASRCGLILSAKEGACFASSEYLLCGIPVVSTFSEGGRSYWYNSYNSIVCEDDESAIANAVEYFVNNPKDPEIIRNTHITRANKLRVKFVSIISEIFEKHCVSEIDPMKFFTENYYHKMRTSYKPDFERIFNEG